MVDKFYRQLHHYQEFLIRKSVKYEYIHTLSPANRLMTIPNMGNYA
jgi:hypothetical protein